MTAIIQFLKIFDTNAPFKNRYLGKTYNLMIYIALSPYSLSTLYFILQL